MTVLSLERLSRDGEAFMEAISRELYVANAGLKPVAELQPIYARYAAIMSDESLAFALAAFNATAGGSEERRRARALLDWQAESQAARELAALDEREIAWESAAAIPLPDGGRIPYRRAAIEIANCRDHAERLVIDAARASLVESELAPICQEHIQREREITERLGLAASYNATFDLLSGISLFRLREECEQFLRQTRAMWDDVYPEFVTRGLGIAPGDATRADALALLRGREFDRHFPSDLMESRIVGQMREMGIAADAGGRIVFDTGEREGKQPRAFCAPVRVPDEVYLVLRPHGGQTDWSTFLHELGHALHFANVRADLPFEYRWLGDNSVTEGYAMLFDHLMQNRRWLRRYASLGPGDAPGFLRTAGFEELHMLRRYCAKLIYETQVYGGGVPWHRLPDLYAELLSDAVTFRYSPADAFVDIDRRYYAARYLRAWQLQALLAETLTGRFDDDWWRNPRAGPWLVEELFGHGQRELAHEQAGRVAAKELSFAPLLRSVEGLLG